MSRYRPGQIRPPGYVCKLCDEVFFASVEMETCGPFGTCDNPRATAHGDTNKGEVMTDTSTVAPESTTAAEQLVSVLFGEDAPPVVAALLGMTADGLKDNIVVSVWLDLADGDGSYAGDDDAKTAITVGKAFTWAAVEFGRKALIPPIEEWMIDHAKSELEFSAQVKPGFEHTALDWLRALTPLSLAEYAEKADVGEPIPEGGDEE